MKPTIPGRLSPLPSVRWGGMSGRDVKCEVAIGVYESDQAWTKAALDNNIGREGIHLANYDTFLLSWCLKKANLDGVVNSKMSRYRLFFSWIYVVSVIEYNLICVPLCLLMPASSDLSVLSSPAFDEAPGSDSSHFSNMFCFLSCIRDHWNSNHERAWLPLMFILLRKNLWCELIAC